MTFIDSRESGSNGNCKSGGRIYKDGQKWHPFIGPFGQMECVICKCVKGNVECRRVECLQENIKTCIYPRKMDGQCCPICSNQDDGKYYAFETEASVLFILYLKRVKEYQP